MRGVLDKSLKAWSKKLQHTESEYRFKLKANKFKNADLDEVEVKSIPWHTLKHKLADQKYFYSLW